MSRMDKNINSMLIECQDENLAPNNRKKKSALPVPVKKGRPRQILTALPLTQENYVNETVGRGRDEGHSAHLKPKPATKPPNKPLTATKSPNTPATKQVGKSAIFGRTKIKPPPATGTAPTGIKVSGQGKSSTVTSVKKLPPPQRTPTATLAPQSKKNLPLPQRTPKATIPPQTPSVPSSAAAGSNAVRTPFGKPKSLVEEQQQSGIHFEKDQSALRSILTNTGVNLHAVRAASEMLKPQRTTQGHGRSLFTPQKMRSSAYTVVPRMSLIDSCRRYQNFLRQERQGMIDEESESASPVLPRGQPLSLATQESPLVKGMKPRRVHGSVYPKYTLSTISRTADQSPGGESATPTTPLAAAKDKDRGATPKTPATAFRRVLCTPSPTTPARRIPIQGSATRGTLTQSAKQTMSQKKLRWADILGSCSPDISPSAGEVKAKADQRVNVVSETGLAFTRTAASTTATAGTAPTPVADGSCSGREPVGQAVKRGGEQAASHVVWPSQRSDGPLSGRSLPLQSASHRLPFSHLPPPPSPPFSSRLVPGSLNTADAALADDDGDADSPPPLTHSDPDAAPAARFHAWRGPSHLCRHHPTATPTTTSATEGGARICGYDGNNLSLSSSDDDDSSEGSGSNGVDKSCPRKAALGDGGDTDLWRRPAPAASAVPPRAAPLPGPPRPPSAPPARHADTPSFRPWPQLRDDTPAGRVSHHHHHNQQLGGGHYQQSQEAFLAPAPHVARDARAPSSVSALLPPPPLSLSSSSLLSKSAAPPAVGADFATTPLSAGCGRSTCASVDTAIIPAGDGRSTATCIATAAARSSRLLSSVTHPSTPSSVLSTADILARLQVLQEQQVAIQHEMQLLRMAMQSEQEGDGNGNHHHSSNANTTKADCASTSNNDNHRHSNSSSGNENGRHRGHHGPSCPQQPGCDCCPGDRPCPPAFPPFSGAEDVVVAAEPVPASLPPGPDFSLPATVAPPCRRPDTLLTPLPTSSSCPAALLFSASGPTTALCNDAFCSTAFSAVDSDSSSSPDINSNILLSDLAKPERQLPSKLRVEGGGSYSDVVFFSVVSPAEDSLTAKRGAEGGDDSCLSRAFSGNPERDGGDSAQVWTVEDCVPSGQRGDAGSLDVQLRSIFSEPAETLMEESKSVRGAVDGSIGAHSSRSSRKSEEATSDDCPNAGSLSHPGQQRRDGLSSLASVRQSVDMEVEESDPRDASLPATPEAPLPGQAPCRQLPAAKAGPVSVIVRPSVVESPPPGHRPCPDTQLRLSPPIWTTLALQSAAAVNRSSAGGDDDDRTQGISDNTNGTDTLQPSAAVTTSAAPPQPHSPTASPDPREVGVVTAAVGRPLTLSPAKFCGRAGSVPKRGSSRAKGRHRSVSPSSPCKRSPLRRTLRVGGGGQAEAMGSALRSADVFLEALLEDECALYAGRLQAFFATLDAARDRHGLPDPVARTLEEGDDMHFLPICEEPVHFSPALEGSAFMCYTPV